jgi:hypothetical protein
MVRVASEHGYWVAFVSAHSLKDPIRERKTLIRALVIDVQGDRLSVRPPGESLSSTLLLTDLSRVESVDLGGASASGS